MKKKGFIFTSILYPMVVFCTGVMAVFLSTGKTNKIIHQMKLDIDNNPFNSVTCDCEAINNAIKNHGDKITSIENTNKDTENKINEINNKLNYGNASAGDILSGKTALVQGNKVTGSMPNRGAYTNAQSVAVAGGTMYVRIPNGAYVTNTGVGLPEITVPGSQLGNASASQVLSGRTFTSSNGLNISGTMPNNGYNIKAPQVVQANGNNLYYRIPVGYYALNTSTGYSEVYAPFADIAKAIGLTANQIVEGNTILGIQGTGKTGISTDDATAKENHILSEKTAYVKGKKVIGSMPSRNGSSQATHISLGASGLYMVFPYGYYPAETHFNRTNSSEVYISNERVADAIGLTADKIKSGVNILGITGTYTKTDRPPTSAQILVGLTAWANGQQINGNMKNYGGNTVGASEATKNGTNIDITVPDTGYYDTSSKLQVPITTIQDAIGSGSGRKVSYKTLYTYRNTSSTNTLGSYTFKEDYDSVIVTITANSHQTANDYTQIMDENGQKTSITKTHKPYGIEYVDSTGQILTTAKQLAYVQTSTSDDTSAVLIIIYYIPNVKKGTKIIGAAPIKNEKGRMHVYAFDNVSSATLLFSNIIKNPPKSNDIQLLHQFKENYRTETAFCSAGNVEDSPRLLPVVARPKDGKGQIVDTQAITDYLTRREGSLREGHVSNVLFNNLSESDWFGVTDVTGTNGSTAYACIKLQ